MILLKGRLGKIITAYCDNDKKCTGNRRLKVEHF
jgi:hypothetical protein